MKSTFIILTASWLFIAIGWFCPQVFKIVGALLYSLGEACENLRSIFNGTYCGIRSKGLHVVAQKPVPPAARVMESKSTPELTEVQTDVLQALVTQGANRKKAEASVLAASIELPKNVSFEDLWRKAIGTVAA